MSSLFHVSGILLLLTFFLPALSVKGQLGYGRFYVLSVHDEDGERLIFQKGDQETYIKGRGRAYSKDYITRDTSYKGLVSWLRPVGKVLIHHNGEKMVLNLDTDSIPHFMDLGFSTLRFDPGSYEIDCLYFYRDVEPQGSYSGHFLDLTPDSLRYTPDTTRKD